jgi:beta-xylosidase
LSRAALPEVNGRPTFVERPKVIYNPRTKKYVMWLHLEQSGYRFSRAGIAISDRPTGPFTFIKAIRPVANTNDYASLTKDPEGEKDFGGTFRDMNLFVDDDGKAYAFYSSEGNWTMYVVRLNDEFTGPELPAVENQTWAKTLARRMREGPAPFKWNGKYYLITSACTGWAPNAADYAVADNILGPYHSQGNPCVGENTEKTIESQSTFVLPVPGKPDAFIFMADRWKPKNISDSRYI